MKRNIIHVMNNMKVENFKSQLSIQFQFYLFIYNRYKNLE